MRIYVASLSDYNEGRLIGIWIDDLSSVEVIEEQVQEMLKTSKSKIAEEWAIHDYEGFYNLNEYESFEAIVEIVEFIEEHGDIGEQILEHTSNDIEESQNMMDNYCGSYDSYESYAMEYCDGIGDIPEHLSFYMDYERMGKDYAMDMITIEESYDTIHFFYNH